MKMKLFNSVDAKGWDASVGALNGTIFHTSAWAEYTVASQPSVVPQYFKLVSDNGAVIGCALGFMESSRLRIMRPFTKNLWFDSTPLVSPKMQDALEVFLRSIHNHARKSGCVRFSIGSYASDTGGNILEALSFDLAKRMEFEIQLEYSSEEDLWNALSENRKRSIRAALKKRVTIEHTDNEDVLTELHRLQGDSALRIMARGGPDMTLQQHTTEDPAANLLRAGAASLILARLEGSIISAALLLTANNYAYYMLAGSNNKGLATRAPSLIVWEALRYFKNQGAAVFNLGGCSINAMDRNSPEHGVYNFKRQFNGKFIECTSGDKVMRVLKHRTATLLKTLFGQ